MFNIEECNKTMFEGLIMHHCAMRLASVRIRTTHSLFSKYLMTAYSMPGTALSSKGITLGGISPQGC